MPSHRFHRKIAELIFGKEIVKKYYWIDKFIDSAYYLSPRNHRKIFGHDKNSLLSTFLLTNDIIALGYHALHILLDEKIDKKKESEFWKLMNVIKSFMD